MSKKNLLKQPIVRNVVAILVSILILVFLGIVATFGKFVVDWILSAGAGTIITIIITAFVCGIVFGVAEMRFVRNKKDDDYYDDF